MNSQQRIGGKAEYSSNKICETKAWLQQSIIYTRVMACPTRILSACLTLSLADLI
jgi:hypothetical protein